MLHHYEQPCEEDFDDRSEADDDIEKGKIRFPSHKLFGRDEELKELRDYYDQVHSSKAESSSSQVVFVDGFSGVGKSALIEGLVQQLKAQSLPVLYTFGKYDEHVSADPFSAIAQAMRRMAQDVQNDNNEKELKRIQHNLQQKGLWDTEEASLLLSILPGLSSIIPAQHSYGSIASSPSHLGRRDLKQLSFVFGNFLQAMCTKERPLILFLDDLQWADMASLELLAPIISSSCNNLQHLLFIGSYQSNKVNEEHMLHKFIQDLQVRRADIQYLSVSNLSPQHMTSFIAETLSLPEKDVEGLTEGIYGRTLGNILFCRQALEELVRKNAIYYDIVFFQWQFNLDGLDLNKLLSLDVIQMVQAKLDGLNPKLQRALAVAAYIRNIVNLPVVLAALKSEYKDLTYKKLQQLMQKGCREGLLLNHPPGSDEYKFSHDRVQEAAFTSIPEGHERDKLMVRIASVLVGLSACSRNSNDDWMLFVAADYFKSVPRHMVLIDPIQLVDLFSKVSELCLHKGSLQQAALLLRAGVGFLQEKRGAWKTEYDLSLQMWNRLIETEFAVGNMEGAKNAIVEVLEHARTLTDMCTAHHTKVALTVQINNHNHELGTVESVRLLRLYGQKIPLHPNKRDVVAERLRLKMALKTRSISILADQPKAKDDSLMKLFFQLCHLLSLTQNHGLNTLVTMRAIRLSLEVGISKYLPEILVTYSAPLRISGRYNTAYSYASVVNKLYERFPEERGGDYATSQMILHSGILPLKLPFHDGIDAHFDCYKIALTAGHVEIAFAAAMHFSMHYYASGLPLNALLEPKLVLFEDKAKQLGQPGFVIIFQCCRQFMYNLQGKSDNPTALKGTVMDEDEIVERLKGSSKKITVRDFSIFRITLAYLFGDMEVMELMMTRLESYPFFDIPLVRQHMRLTFHGLAAFTLARVKKSRDYRQLGNKMLREIRKLDKIGSVNAHPVLLCFKAVDKHNKAAYDEAIAACVSARVVHLEAAMSEQCGLLLLEQGNEDTAKEYLTNALWLFNDWGANAKVKRLQQEHEFFATLPPPSDHTMRTSVSGFNANTAQMESEPKDTATVTTKADNPAKMSVKKVKQRNRAFFSHS